MRGQLRQVREIESRHISFEMKERRNSGMAHRFPVVGPEKISRAITEMKMQRTFGTCRHFSCHPERKLRERDACYLHKDTGPLEKEAGEKMYHLLLETGHFR